MKKRIDPFILCLGAWRRWGVSRGEIIFGLRCDRISFESMYVSDGDFFCFTRKEPVGVCAQIIPVSHV